jgi:hypothetical protein
MTGKDDDWPSMYDEIEAMLRASENIYAFCRLRQAVREGTLEKTPILKTIIGDNILFPDMLDAFEANETMLREVGPKKFTSMVFQTVQMMGRKKQKMFAEKMKSKNQNNDKDVQPIWPLHFAHFGDACHETELVYIILITISTREWSSTFVERSRRKISSPTLKLA